MYLQLGPRRDTTRALSCVTFTSAREGQRITECIIVTCSRRPMQQRTLHWLIQPAETRRKAQTPRWNALSFNSTIETQLRPWRSPDSPPATFRRPIYTYRGDGAGASSGSQRLSTVSLPLKHSVLGGLDSTLVSCGATSLTSPTRVISHTQTPELCLLTCQADAQ